MLVVVSDNPCMRTTGRGWLLDRSRSCLVRYGDTALSDPPRLWLSTTLSKSAATTCLRKARSSAVDARRVLHARGRVLRLIAGCATRRVETTCNRCAAREHARVASGCICQSYGMSSIGSSALFLPLRACLVTVSRYQERDIRSVLLLFGTLGKSRPPHRLFNCPCSVRQRPHRIAHVEMLRRRRRLVNSATCPVPRMWRS